MYIFTLCPIFALDDTRLSSASGYEVSPKVFQPSNCAVKLDFPSKFFVVITDIALVIPADLPIRLSAAQVSL